jgi:cyclophilin family peptidyl-prolyl cis-trans isomerase
MRPALALTTLLALACAPPQVPAPPPASPPVAAPAPPPATAAPPLHELERRRDSAAILARKELTPELLLALARIGDRPALDALLAALRSDDPRQREHAARALGIAALLDADPTDLEPALLAAWPRADPDERIAIAEALGRLGTPAALPPLRDALSPQNPPALRSAAAIALGVLGRRKHPLDEPTRQALLTALEALGYPALYALANDPTPPPDPAILARLRSHAAATDPELQRLALAALARRSALPPLQACLTRELLAAARDPKHLDALLGKDPTKSISTLLTWARATLTTPAPSDRDALHHARQLHAALNCLASESTAPTKPQRRALTYLRNLLRPLLTAPTTNNLRQRTLARIDCQLAQRLAHDPAWRPPLVCGEPFIDPTDRTIQQLIPISHGFGGPPRNPRTHRIAGVRPPRPPHRRDLRPRPPVEPPTNRPHRRILLLKILNDRTPGVLGTALDLIAAHHSATPRPPPLTAADPLWQRLAALTPADPELHSTLLAALAATRVPASLSLCEASRAHPSPAVRKSARTCVTELSGKDPGPTTSTAPIPALPFDPTPLLDKTIVWTLTTHLGDLTIDLDPRAAPWAVAAIVDLTKRGFYNNLIFHRDVPGFVLQGGDPEGTGWGGPGFLLPSEPTNNPYTRGALGIADAGKDTGGSQFFFMYARAPHLEGRYTSIGRLRPEHLDRLDELTLGDRIIKARIELTPP